MKKNPVKFWVAVKIQVQIGFDPDNPKRQINVDKEALVGEQHIVYSEVLMCKDSRDRLKRSVKANKDKTAQTRFLNVPVCKACQEAYKNHPDLPYSKFVISPPPRRSGEIKMNPMILEKNNET